MAAFTLDGSEFTVKLREPDAEFLARRLNQGRSATRDAVEGEAVRRDDQLVGNAVCGTWHIMPLLAAVEREETDNRLSAGVLLGVGIGFATFGLSVLIPAGVSLASGAETTVPATKLGHPVVFLMVGVVMTLFSRFLRMRSLFGRNTPARHLVDKVSMSLGVGHKAVYVGSATQDKDDLLLGDVRLIRYDAIGDASGHDGHLRIDDRAGRPLVTMGVAGDGRELRKMVAFIRGRIPA